MQHFDKGAMLRLIFGADGPQCDGLAVPGHCLHQFGGIGGDGETLGAASRVAAHTHPGIEREHALVIGQKRIDVEFRQFRQVDQHLGHGNQCIVNGVETSRRMVAVAGQQFGNAGPGDQFARQHPI